jgi:hypothetical protein
LILHTISRNLGGGVSTRAIATAALISACARDSRDIHAANLEPARDPSRITTESFPLCPLIGPYTHSPGVYGTDLGFTVRDPQDESRLAILFGDTWARPGGACQYPMPGSDDLLGWLPAKRPSVLQAGPPTSRGPSACQSLNYSRTDDRDRTSWQRIRLLEGGDGNDRDSVLDTGTLKTPVSAFSDGQKLFAIYGRNDIAYCKRSRECPVDMECSRDPSYRGKRLGVCARTSAANDGAAPTYCRDVSDCGPGFGCKSADRGVCLAASAFKIRSPRGLVAPSWYRDDPRLGIAQTMYVAARVSAERPADFAIVQRFVTNRFIDVAAKTVAHFDEEHPETNDYRPGSHTLLLWGRRTFFAMGGTQNLPFLLHVPLSDLRSGKGTIRWRPRFFAGYDTAGAPQWSDRESDAEPVYGTDARLSVDGRIEWVEPEFDYDNQMTVSFIAPLGRWIMLYGGDLPAFMIRNPITGETPNPTFLQPSPGAIHLRTAPHPWGRLRADPLQNPGFSSPDPVLTRGVAAHYLACGSGGDEETPGCIEGARAEPRDSTSAPVSLGTALSCVMGDFALSTQHRLSGNPVGRLYAPNIIDEWTEDVTGKTTLLSPEERVVEIYWNVSTWNPYQVVLVKTRLRGSVAPR